MYIMKYHSINLLQVSKIRRIFLQNTILLISVLLLQIGCDDNSERALVPTYQLCVVDSIGSSDMYDDNYVFGDIRDVCVADSLIFVLDRAQSCIKVFKLNGVYHTQISQYGHGPGELIYPTFMTITEANTIIVVDGGSGLSEFTTTGEYLGNPLGEYTNPPIFIDGYKANSFLGLHSDFSFNDNGLLQADVRVGLFTDSMEPDVIFFRKERTIAIEDIGNFIYELYNSVVFKSIGYDQVCVGVLSDSEYNITIFNSTADTIAIYLEHADVVPKTTQEIENEEEYYDYIFEFDHGPIQINENHNTLSNIAGFDSQMHVWIYTEASANAFSVFDTEANLIYNVFLPLDVFEESIADYWRFTIKGNAIYAWSETETDFQKLYILQLDSYE